ncbi:hypothetical protein JXA63_03510 [Candidatus Woesebacteria bacterium]|nr:hypothetical protein [Candidatus Woesebacteria bacterium]
MNESGIEFSGEPRKRPGGPLVEKPVQGKDGSWHYMGETIAEGDAVDISYSIDFWRRYVHDTPKFRESLRNAMIGNIKKSIDEGGEFKTFVNHDGIDERDKEKISAYRRLAREFGYKIGEVKHKEGTATAIGTIKIEPKSTS